MNNKVTTSFTPWKARFHFDGSDKQCNFCGKYESEVEKVIEGPKSRICNECVSLCNTMIAEHRAEGQPNFTDSSIYQQGEKLMRLGELMMTPGAGVSELVWAAGAAGLSIDTVIRQVDNHTDSEK